MAIIREPVGIPRTFKAGGGNIWALNLAQVEWGIKIGDLWREKLCGFLTALA